MKRIEKTVEAKCCRPMLLRAFDEPDPTVSERREVLTDGASAGPLVDSNGHDSSASQFSRRDRNDWNPGTVRYFYEIEIIRERRRNDQPGGTLMFENGGKKPDSVDLMGIHGPRDEIKAKGRAASQGAKLQARIVIAVRLKLRAMGMDEHDLPAHPTGERSRLLIDRITKFLDRALHTLARFGPHIRAIVEHSRNGDARDTGRLGDIVNCRVAFRHARRLASVSTVRNGGYTSLPATEAHS
jgi:hypothetical protein